MSKKSKKTQPTGETIRIKFILWVHPAVWGALMGAGTSTIVWFFIR